MKKGFLLFLISLLWLAGTRVALAEADTLLLESKYFSVYAPKEFDKHSLLSKFNFNYLLQPENIADKDGTDPNDILSKSFDGLYSAVSDILDIHIYSFHGTIRIVPTKTSLSILCKQLYGVNFNEPSLYAHDKNTIYIAMDQFTVGMLGHEIAHAIISHFFVVPPPTKLQEVLAGYVEYSLRKLGTHPN